jgi:succinate dehydrogenase/fumarate reductase flavoprotein subunit
MAYGVTCGMAHLSYRVFRFHSTDSSATGITFTYAGLKTDTSAHVLNNEGLRMPGLWAVGEISGGFFAFNYPRGAGLPKGAVFGRIAGQAAAKRAKEFESGSEAKMNGQSKKVESAVSDNKPNAAMNLQDE